MRFSSGQFLNGFAMCGVAAMMISAAINDGDAGANPGIDTIITASISADNANRFLAVDHRSEKSCVLALHRAEGYDVHRVEPSADCANVGSLLSEARAWREDAKGTVTVTDYRGDALMKLSRGDGFAWEVIVPTNREISLSAW